MDHLIGGQADIDVLFFLDLDGHSVRIDPFVEAEPSEGPIEREIGEKGEEKGP